MNELLNRSRLCGRLVVCVVLAGILISAGTVKPALAQACDKVGGKIGGAVIGGGAGSMFGKGRGRRGAALGGALWHNGLESRSAGESSLPPRA